MAGWKLIISVKGFSAAANKLGKIIGVAMRPSVPMRQASIFLASETIKNFDAQGRPEKWAPLSLITLFIRAHREGAKNRKPSIMEDSGRLKGSILPVVDEGGKVFGAATNVEYAELMQEGGITKPSDVQIAKFRRRKPGSKAGGHSKPGSAVGMVRGISNAHTRNGGAFATVRAYTMHLKGGATVVSRPFFPLGIAQYEEWGYGEKVRRIFSDHVKSVLNGTYGDAA